MISLKLTVISSLLSWPFVIITSSHSLNNVLIVKEQIMKNLMCWNKYLHKKKKFKIAKKKKNEKSDEFSDKFDDNFTLNSTFNLIFKSFLNTKSSASILNFMSVTNQHSLSVWIINTETSDYLCSMWEFFSSY